MSEAAQKTKTSWKSKIAQIIIILAVALIGLGYWYSTWPVYWEAQGKIHDKLAREHTVNAEQLEDESEKMVRTAERKRKVSPNIDLLMSFMPGATRARDLVRVQKAVDARMADQDESVLSTEVKVDQRDWGTLREVRVPTRITVVGLVTPEFYQEQKSGPAGLIWYPDKGKRDQTVLMHDRGLKQPTADTGNLNEAIARLCDDPNGANCRLGMPVGQDAVLCVGPGLHEGGFVQGWYNGLITLDGLVQNLYFAGTVTATGKFKFIFTPDDLPNGRDFATKVCEAHPGALVVKNPDPPSTTIGIIVNNKS